MRTLVQDRLPAWAKQHGYEVRWCSTDTLRMMQSEKNPRRSRESDHLCSDRVDHTKNARETQHHPRRRRAALGARQKIAPFDPKEGARALKIAAEEHGKPFGPRQIGKMHCTGPLFGGRTGQAQWHIFGEQTRSNSRERRRKSSRGENGASLTMFFMRNAYPRSTSPAGQMAGKLKQ